MSAAFGAIIGGLITYLVTTTSTKRLREYHAKEHAYIKAIEVDEEELKKLDRDIKLDYVEHLINLSGNEEVLNLFRKIRSDTGNNRQNYAKSLESEFIPAVKRDLQDTLNPQHRWQFWR